MVLRHPTGARTAATPTPPSDARLLLPPAARPAATSSSPRGTLLRFKQWLGDWFEILDFRSAVAYRADADGNLVPTRDRSDDA